MELENRFEKPQPSTHFKENKQRTMGKREQKWLLYFVILSCHTFYGLNRVVAPLTLVKKCQKFFCGTLA